MNAGIPPLPTREGRLRHPHRRAARDLEAAGIERRHAEPQTFLGRLRNVAEPAAVLPLPKTEYLDDSGTIGNRTVLADEINAMVGGWLDSEGALGLRGGWGPIDDYEVDALIETIYAARWRDTGRLVELED